MRHSRSEATLLAPEESIADELEELRDDADESIPDEASSRIDLVAARHQPGRVIEHEGLRSRGELRHRERDAHQCWSFGGGVRSSDSAKW